MHLMCECGFDNTRRTYTITDHVLELTLMAASMYNLRSLSSAGKLECSGCLSLASTRDATANALMAMPFHAATTCKTVIKQGLATVSFISLGRK